MAETPGIPTARKACPTHSERLTTLSLGDPDPELAPQEEAASRHADLGGVRARSLPGQSVGLSSGLTQLQPGGWKQRLWESVQECQAAHREWPQSSFPLLPCVPFEIFTIHALVLLFSCLKNAYVV